MYITILGSNSASSGASSGPPPSVVQYDDAVEDSIKNFLELCDKLGGDVAALVSFLFCHYKEMFYIIFYCRKIN